LAKVASKQAIFHGHSDQLASLAVKTFRVSELNSYAVSSYFRRDQSYGQISFDESIGPIHHLPERYSGRLQYGATDFDAGLFHHLLAPGTPGRSGHTDPTPYQHAVALTNTAAGNPIG
jgi:hypothetical protein